MKTSLHKLLILCCALYLSGAHWVVLQSTAWTGMLISRTMSASVSEAVETTFDGQHPCRMCSAIADAKQTEEHSEKNFDILKKAGEVKFLEPTYSARWVQLPESPVVWPVLCLEAASRVDAPPTPPPLA